MEASCKNAVCLKAYLVKFSEWAKRRISLATMFVLSEYLTSETGQHSVGKLRVRGVQIRRELGKVLNRGENKKWFQPEDPGKLERGTTLGLTLSFFLGVGLTKYFFIFLSSSWILIQLTERSILTPLHGRLVPQRLRTNKSPFSG